MKIQYRGNMNLAYFVLVVDFSHPDRKQARNRVRRCASIRKTSLI